MNHPMLPGEKRGSFEVLCDILRALRNGDMLLTRIFWFANTGWKSANKLLDIGINAGLIEKIPHINGRTKYFFSITPRGRLVLDHIEAARLLLRHEPDSENAVAP